GGGVLAGGAGLAGGARCVIGRDTGGRGLRSVFGSSPVKRRRSRSYADSGRVGCGLAGAGALSGADVAAGGGFAASEAASSPFVVSVGVADPGCPDGEGAKRIQAPTASATTMS